MGHTREAREYEHVPHLAVTVECELMVHQRLQLRFDQVTALFGRLFRVIVGERVAGDHACVVRLRNDHLQWLGVDADARGSQSLFAAQVEVVIGNERFGQLFQRNIPATELVGEELRQPLAHVVVLAVGGLRTIDTDVLLEVAVELIERFQQRFVLLAHTEVG